MNDVNGLPGIQGQPGIASAEDGYVVLDGPDGVAVTMTSEAAEGTGRSLLAAAEEAVRQVAGRKAAAPDTPTSAEE